MYVVSHYLGHSLTCKHGIFYTRYELLSLLRRSNTFFNLNMIYVGLNHIINDRSALETACNHMKIVFRNSQWIWKKAMIFTWDSIFMTRTSLSLNFLENVTPSFLTATYTIGIHVMEYWSLLYIKSPLFLYEIQFWKRFAQFCNLLLPLCFNSMIIPFEWLLYNRFGEISDFWDMSTHKKGGGCRIVL